MTNLSAQKVAFNSNVSIPTYVLNSAEVAHLSELRDALGPAFNMASPDKQVRIARFAANNVRLAAPTLSAALAEGLVDTPIQRIRGIPIDDHGAALLCTVLTLLRSGEVFQYAEQNDGVLTAPIRPKADGALNSNSSPEPFGPHCDDSAMPSDFRTEEIALLAVHNPPGTLTGFAILKEIMP